MPPKSKFNFKVVDDNRNINEIPGRKIPIRVGNTPPKQSRFTVRKRNSPPKQSRFTVRKRKSPPKKSKFKVIDVDGHIERNPNDVENIMLKYVENFKYLQKSPPKKSRFNVVGDNRNIDEILGYRFKLGKNPSK